MSNDDSLVELRGDILQDHMDVIDAVVQATPGANRMTVVRKIINEWVEHEKHRAMLVTRVTAGNGSGSEAGRNRSGTGPASGRKP